MIALDVIEFSPFHVVTTNVDEVRRRANPLASSAPQRVRDDAKIQACLKPGFVRTLLK